MRQCNDILNSLRGGLVVSVQPVEAGPLDTTDSIVAMARAAVDGGAAGLRIQGVQHLAAVRKVVSIPIIGIVKRDSTETPVRITPTIADAEQLITAGADIVAIDMTNRSRPVPAALVAETVLRSGVLLMADCSDAADGAAAFAAGAHIIGTTLSGYTDATAALLASDTEPTPDFALIKSFRGIAGDKGFVMAEGRFNTPALAAEAIRHGADCVTVGSAITRLEHVTGWFDQSIRRSSHSGE